MYAGRKRKKPVPKSPKPPPPEGMKSNPSKRHRDRLNQELNKLTGLLPFPEDVRTRLDKLSILRLAVGYLKVKSYLMAAATDVGDHVLDQSRTPGENGRVDLQVNKELIPEGELLLQALNGFVIAVTGDGYIFYISPTVQDYLGFHQSDLIYRSVYELIHADDRATFRCQLHGALVSGSTQQAANAFPGDQLLLAGCSAASSPQHLCPKKPSFMERSFTCRFCCLLDNSSGFLALNFCGRLKCLLGQQKRASDRSPLVLFAIATPLQPLSILELRTKTLIFQTKHKLDFTPMACDAWGKVVLGYTEMELCRRGSGYQFVHAADMMYCAENHVRMMKTGESGLTVFRLLTKKGGWVWVEANAWLVYKGGKPDFIIARQRALSNEEGEEHLRKRNLQLPFSFATGEAVLYRNDLPEFLDSFQAKEESQTQADSCTGQHLVDPNSLLGAMMKQDASIYISHADNVPQFSLPDLIAEPDRLSQNEEVGDAKEDDSLLVVTKTLFEKTKVDGNICQTFQSLNMDSAELQRWEETLLSLGAAEEPPAHEAGESLGTEMTSCVEQMLLREDAGKSMDLLHCSTLPCNKGNSAVAHFQHCWAANSAFQAPSQPQTPGAQGQDAMVSLVSVTSEVISAQPEQQVPFNPARLVGGTALDVLVSSNKSSVALQLANPEQAIEAGVTTYALVDNTIPDDQSQPDCELVGSICPPPLHSNALVTRRHNVPIQANPANALGQRSSPAGCPSDAWMATAPKQLEAAGIHLESQTQLASSPESLLGAGLWLLPSQPAPCPARGLHESLFSGAGQLCGAEAALPAQASAHLGVSQLRGDGGFPKQPPILPLEPSFSWEGEQDKWLVQHQSWLLHTGAAPWRCVGAGPVQHSGLLLGSSMGPSTHQMDHILLPECQYRNNLLGHDSAFLNDASKISLPQQLGAVPCPSESHPGASCSSLGSILRCSAGLPAKVGAGALPPSEQGPGFPSASFAGQQPLCACEVQLKVRCEGCST
ncbi:uncharacterized protein LOC142057689 [Phalacrocorax aristotelis]|uniref:uncharacterized protein LOC142057689 n=1 Tax=Phalacrocorax aristotelis TaxID=126867 RepID=UPI003F4BA2CB